MPIPHERVSMKVDLDETFESGGRQWNALLLFIP